MDRRLQMVSSREGHHTVQRIVPQMPVQTMETFAVVSPVDTHTKQIRCEQVDPVCVRYRDGWRTVLDTSTVQGAKQARWITNFSGRSYTKVEIGPVVTFTFASGQQCFNDHRVSLGRPELYVVRDGDWRGNPTGQRRQHTKPEHWVEEHSESLDRIHKAQQRG